MRFYFSMNASFEKNINNETKIPGMGAMIKKTAPSLFVINSLLENKALELWRIN
jgi:hypothetical protein